MVIQGSLISTVTGLRFSVGVGNFLFDSTKSRLAPSTPSLLSNGHRYLFSLRKSVQSQELASQLHLVLRVRTRRAIPSHFSMP